MNNEVSIAHVPEEENCSGMHRENDKGLCMQYSSNSFSKTYLITKHVPPKSPRRSGKRKLSVIGNVWLL